MATGTHILVDAKTGEPVTIPVERPSMRGEMYTIIEAVPPAYKGTSGRVYCHLSIDDQSSTHGQYPEVFGLKWKAS